MAGLVRITGLGKRFRKAAQPAIDDIDMEILPGRISGLVGPDGAGKTTLIRLIAGLLRPDRGRILVDGIDPARDPVAVRQILGYMPQRLGLYEDLTVLENLSLYADMQSVAGAERARSFERLLTFTGLGPFTDRLAGNLSGGMKQKLGLACTLVRVPKLLLLDEPSVGVDPISRRELWHMTRSLIEEGVAVVWSTAYLDEAEQCDDVLLLNQGKVVYSGVPAALTAELEGRSFLIRGLGHERRAVLEKLLPLDGVMDGVIQGGDIRLVLSAGPAPSAAIEQGGLGANVKLEATPPRFEDAFVARLGGRGKAPSPYTGQPMRADGGAADAVLVEARGLTKRFGAFTAADNISFAIRRGEIFGLLGPNGAGKSTTFKMMCGLLRPTAGDASVAGKDLYRAGTEARGRIGYMAQRFSLYGDLSVRQNLDFFAGIYGLGRRRHQVIRRMVEAFALEPFLEQDAGGLPLGFRQRLALACATMHDPVALFLDEPTSGVDPLTRREFWSHISALVERGVTVMVTTHFMDEAEYCDRIGLVYQGRVIAEGSPDALKESAATTDQPAPTLEDAFIALVERQGSRNAA